MGKNKRLVKQPTAVKLENFVTPSAILNSTNARWQDLIIRSVVDSTTANTCPRYRLHASVERKKKCVLNKLRVWTTAAVLVGLLTCGASLLVDVWDCYVQHVGSKGFQDAGVPSLSLLRCWIWKVALEQKSARCITHADKALAFCTYVIFMHSPLSRLAEQTHDCKSSNGDLPLPIPITLQKKDTIYQLLFKR